MKQGPFFALNTGNTTYSGEVGFIVTGAPASTTVGKVSVYYVVEGIMIGAQSQYN